MKIKNLFATALAVLGVVACQNKPSTAEGVTVDPTEIEFAKEGETKDVTITTADEWKLSVPDELSWLEISEKKGTGTTKVTFKAPDNTNGFNRSGNITVKAGMYSAKIKVFQPGKGEKVDSQIEKLLALDGYSADKDKDVNLEDVWWVAKYPNNGVITDGVAFITVYGACDGAVGEKGTITGKLGNHSYRNQVTSPAFTKTGDVEVNHGTALELKDEIDTYGWKDSPIIYVHVVGTARETEDGKYINIKLEGRVKDVSFASSTVDGKQYKDKEIDFYGYFVSGTDHISVVPVGEITVKGEAAPELKLSVSAKQTETGFEASWNEVAGATKYAWELLKGEAKVDGADVTATSVSKEIALEAGTAYTVKVKALNGSEELISATASFTARDMSGSAEEVTLTIPMNNTDLTWESDTHSEYGEGFVAEYEGVTLKYYKGGSNTAPSQGLVADHIRLYKNSQFFIEAGSAVVSVIFTCTYSDKTFEFTASDGTKGVADTAAKTVTWTGNLSPFQAEMTGGQNRVKQIELTYVK